MLHVTYLGMMIFSVFGSLMIPFFLPAVACDAVLAASIAADVRAVPPVSIVDAAEIFAPWVIVFKTTIMNRLSGPTCGSLVLAATWCNETYPVLPIVTLDFGLWMQKNPILSAPYNRQEFRKSVAPLYITNPRSALPCWRWVLTMVFAERDGLGEGVLAGMGGCLGEYVNVL